MSTLKSQITRLTSVARGYVLCDYDITAPFKVGKLAYITDGRLIIRLHDKSLVTAATKGKFPPVAKFFTGLRRVKKWSKFPAMPPVCPKCWGTYKSITCPTCGHSEECRCEGFEDHDEGIKYHAQRVHLSGVYFLQLRYASLLAALPASRWGIDEKQPDYVLVKFTGGEACAARLDCGVTE